jgi:hypothetical protein
MSGCSILFIFLSHLLQCTGIMIVCISFLYLCLGVMPVDGTKTGWIQHTVCWGEIIGHALGSGQPRVIQRCCWSVRHEQGHIAQGCENGVQVAVSGKRYDFMCWLVWFADMLMLVFMNEGSEIWFNTCLPFLWNMHVTRLGFSLNTCCVSKLPLFVCRQSVTT